MQTAPTSNKHHLFQAGGVRRTTLLLALGFFLSTGLFAVLIAYGLNKLHSSQDNVREIIQNHNIKVDLISKMHISARERTLIMHRMITLDDPFERDELFLEFNSHGAAFASARMTLISMSLSPIEETIVEHQGLLTRSAVPLQERVVELVQEDNTSSARKLLTKKAMPAQNRVLNTLNELQEYQRVSITDLSNLTREEQQRTRTFILILGGMAILLSIVIAIYTIKRILRIERGLFIEKEQAEMTLHSIGDAVITTDFEGNIEMMNPRAENITGYSSANAKGKPLHEVFHVLFEYNHEPIPDPISEVLSGGAIIKSTQTEVLLNRDKQQFAIEHTVAPIKGPDGSILGAIIIFRDETENRALASKLTYQASHDMLTGLVNRHEFESRLEQTLPVVISQELPYAICYMDLDQFKIINDTCGHNAGDEMLRQISHVLRGNLRKSDTLARLGGDEFGVLLEGCTIDKAREIAETLLSSINDFHFSWEGQVFDIGVSIGVAPITAVTANLAELLSAADSACYVAKGMGRNRVHVYHPEDSELEKHRGEIQWAARIKTALENNSFVLYYQTIASLKKSHTNMQHEILLRMLDEDNQLVAPMAFIPAAERYDLMPLIDKWVIQNTFRHISDNPHCNMDEHFFSINISGQSLSTPGFSHFVHEQLRLSAINPEKICIEITETAAITNMADAIEFINSLKSIGCRFSLDDFGSGLSSFSYLKNLPVDYIKIDGSFVRDICEDITDHAFVESIAQIGHVMNIQTIAEYVENQDILAELTLIGVDYAQGFHLALPSPLSEFTSIDIKLKVKQKESA